MADHRARILGTGVGIPSRRVTNQDISQFVDTNDEWISSRTGIRERRFVDREKNESNASISLEAAKKALARAKLSADQITLIICCTATPDTWIPITAARIAGGLGIRTAGTFDLNAACSGFLSGLHVADGLIRAGFHKNILVVGSDVFSSILDWDNRAVSVLFGDGAGAAVVSATEVTSPEKDSYILGSRLYTFFDEKEILSVPGGGSRVPFAAPEFGKSAKPYLEMEGKEVFKLATRHMADCASALMKEHGVTKDDITWFIPHQANLRIIEMVGKLLDLPKEKVFVNVDRWGNTTAGTVPICMGEMEEQGLLKKGDLIMLDVFGAGFTYGAALLRW